MALADFKDAYTVLSELLQVLMWEFINRQLRTPIYSVRCDVLAQELELCIHNTVCKNTPENSFGREENDRWLEWRLVDELESIAENHMNRKRDEDGNTAELFRDS